jgi:rod shape-determining protein MreD
VIPSFDDQINWGLALCIFVVAALLQIALGPMLALSGGHADLLLVVVAGWALLRSPEEAMIAGPPAALLVGLLEAGPIGIPILTLILPIGMALMLRSGGAIPKLPSLVLVVGVSSLVGVLVDLIVQFLSGARGFDFGGFVPVLLGAAALNIVLCVLSYRPLCIGRKRKLVRRTRLTLSRGMN